MKLAKLLGLGTSFFGGGQMAAYRLNKRGWLPTFNEGRNPFALKADAVAATPDPKAPGAAARSVPVKASTGPAGALEREPQRAMVKAGISAPGTFKPAAQAVKPQPAGPETGAPVKARPGWTTRLNPFRAPEPAAAQPARAVQEELSLAGVKVVHNDLTDADVEIVPLKARAGAPASAPALSPARQAWENVGGNLLKSS